jgi:hypothetical protein
MSDGPEYAHEITAPGRPRTVEVADGVYAYVQPDGSVWSVSITLWPVRISPASSGMLQ